MEWIVTIVYILGAITAHCFIYSNDNGEIEHQSANIACMLWPVALAIWLLLKIENLIKSIR